MPTNAVAAEPPDSRFAIGALVRARGREWVVLPGSSGHLLRLRPLGGADDEVAGLVTALEPVEAAHFALPSVDDLGDWRSGRLLRDAVRLGFRSSAGPLRSFGRLGFEPRPYQLVPLLMALRLNPVRLLIADDVGVGKTVEAGLIARELLDRGEVRRIAVLCPPHLAEQWRRELEEKFSIDAELVLAGTARRLESRSAAHGSIFDAFPHVIVSTDFIKGSRRRDEFLRACPELVIVDEAHTCAHPADARGPRHLRHRLVKDLVERDPKRHVVLVTATPHSGDEGAFRSLLALLDPSFASLPDELGGKENELHRRRLARHLVQRRRGDIRRFLQAETPFPTRKEREDTYALTPEYKRLFARVLNYARETVDAAEAGSVRQRVRWWSALSLLRALASSPAAAAATLRSRAANADAKDLTTADAIGAASVLDLADDDAASSSDGANSDEPGSDQSSDVAPGGDAIDDAAADGPAARRRLNELARDSDALAGDGLDAKLRKATDCVRGLVAEGFNPIVFCRFIDTAKYVAGHVSKKLREVGVECVTGELAPADRASRVAALGSASPKRVLVCTDCLSEGINLQQHFDAVVHYDLSWSPTRHEQREGRVDRYGQPSPEVRVVTLYGIDNQIDGIVLDILLRKHKSIRHSLGISVAVPIDSEAVVKAIFEGLMLRGRTSRGDDNQLNLFDEDVLAPIRRRVHDQWDDATEREKRSRTIYAQETIRPDEVAAELEEVRAALGTDAQLRSFCADALATLGAHVVQPAGDAIAAELRPLPSTLADGLRLAGVDGPVLRGRFAPPVPAGELSLTRTHPVVERLAGFVLDAALDPLAPADARAARRAGVVRTSAVSRRTTLLVLRLRHQITTDGGEALLAEECQTLAFEGSPESAAWLDAAAADRLLAAAPSGNVAPEQAHAFIVRVLDGISHLAPQLEACANQRADALRASHDRVRIATRGRPATHVTPKLPVDVLGVYVYLPAAS